MLNSRNLLFYEKAVILLAIPKSLISYARNIVKLSQVIERTR